MTKHKANQTAGRFHLLAILLLKISRTDIAKRLGKYRTDITPLQFGVLSLLCHETQTISELSEKMIIEPATLVPVIDALEKKKLVSRQRDPRDRRRTPLRATMAGKKLIDLVGFSQKNDSLSQALKKMGQKGNQLLILMEELVERMTEPRLEDKKFLQLLNRHFKF